ncbi:MULTISPECIES: DUF6941 family protein [Amycolatopsis]|uniref:DUF6941 family protein n=1 Tax=Amycolatopsis albidoflavus TaxID=102226 RepID=A0ABW5IGP7_9PSEU
MRVNVLLGDSAQVDVGGKAHVLGMGWTKTGVPTGPMAVVVLISLDDEAEVTKPHDVVIKLMDQRGEVVDLSAVGARRMEFEAKIEPRPDVQVELPSVAPIAIQLVGLQLSPGESYVWQVDVDGRSESAWSASFTTHPEMAGIPVNTA